MHTTSITLLERLRRADDAEAWQRLVRVYRPLLIAWARRAGANATDAEDLTQDVFAILVKTLPAFLRRPEGSFRSFLRTVALNKLRDRQRHSNVAAEVPLDGVPEPAADEWWDREYRYRLLQEALELIRGEFSTPTWDACQEFMLSGRPAADVAAHFQVSVNAIYVAKSRAIRRLRNELAGMID